MICDKQQGSLIGDAGQLAGVYPAKRVGYDAHGKV
jgi:hypothetical protein